MELRLFLKFPLHCSYLLQLPIAYTWAAFIRARWRSIPRGCDSEAEAQTGLEKETQGSWCEWHHGSNGVSKIRQRGNLQSHSRPERAGSCLKGNPKGKHGQGGQCLRTGTGLGSQLG